MLSRLFILAALLLACSFAPSSGEYQVGVGVVDVSASEEEISTRRIFMGGYGFLGFRDGAIPKPAIGVHDPIWARTFLVSNGNTTVAMTVLDTTGISNIILDRIRTGASKETGIPVDNILVGATHTHCGPDLQGLWGSVTDSYLDFVVNGTIASIASAFKGRQPARLMVSGGQGYSRNRRGWDYTDTEITVLDALSLKDGSRIGTFINFAAHTTALNNQVRELSGDWAHYTRVAAEARLGAPVIFSNGPIGDVSPQPSGEGDQFDRANTYGSDIANLAVDSIASQIEISSEIHISTTYFTLDVTNILFIAALETGIINYKYEGGPITGYKIRTRATYLRFGDQVQGCAFPGESLTRNAEPIKGAMQTKNKFFLGLNGDTLGYFVPTDEWESGMNGGYEESVSLGREVGDITRDQIIRLIQQDPSFP